MAIAATIGMMEDAVKAVMRMFGRHTGPEAYPYSTPQDLLSAIHHPSTEGPAVARMRKLHYGSFYKKEWKDRPFGPQENILRERTMFSGMAESELLRKGKGFGGAVFGRPVKGLSIGLSHLKGLGYFAIGTGVLGGAFAEKGHKVSGFAGGVARTLAYAVGDVVGSVIGGPLAGLALGLVTEKAGGIVEEGIQMFHDFNKNIKHVNMGGNYEDTRVAYTMRQRAAQEMGSSVMNARRYLGSEALLLHQ